jgi:uncharacterized protein YjiS (DUF1127 family)
MLALRKSRLRVDALKLTFPATQTRFGIAWRIGVLRRSNMTAIHLQPCKDSARKLARRDAIEALNDATQWVFATAREWRRRIHERAQLAKLDDRMLADIGISRAEQTYLANKPFWRE